MFDLKSFLQTHFKKTATAWIVFSALISFIIEIIFWESGRNITDALVVASPTFSVLFFSASLDVHYSDNNTKFPFPLFITAGFMLILWIKEVKLLNNYWFDSVLLQGVLLITFLILLGKIKDLSLPNYKTTELS